MNVVVLAAGLGKRMHSQLPKVLQPIAGRPMLEWVLKAASPLLGTGKLVVVVGHGAQAVRERVSPVFPQAEFALQERQLGTGHAVRQALPLIDMQDPVTMVLVGDAPLIETGTLRSLAQASSDGKCVGLLTAVLRDATGYGRIVRDRSDNIERIVEHKDATPAQRGIREVNTGLMALPTARLAAWLAELGTGNAQGEYYLTDVIEFAVRDGVAVRAAQTSSEWEAEGANDKATLAKLERLYQSRVAAGLMAQGVTLLDPARIDVRGELVCGSDVQIDVGCVFEGKVVLGDGVKIGAYCVVRDSEIESGTELLPMCHLDGARVGPECRVGPWSRLRPGSSLADHVHVGNFCELKKSAVGSGSKINHLSYIGDTTMGSGVNIGAGTITCNYDGVNKFRTEIGDGAFIGSDTQLVAPVKVGAGATLGAGTTLTKEAPAGQLTISRARQVTLPNWKRPVKKPA